MANFSFPPELVSNVKTIADLDDETLSKTLEVLRSETASLYPSEIASTLSDKIHGLGRSRADAAVSCIIALELARASTGVATNDLITEIVSAAVTERSDEPKRERLTMWFRDAIGIEPLIISAKGMSVSQDCEHPFLDSRIITEIRPVYKESGSELPKEPPSAAVILHSLKLVVREDGRAKEFFLALDSADLARLKQTLERAEAKAESLQTFLKSAKLSYLKVKTEGR
jgi:hypothetical protein